MSTRIGILLALAGMLIAFTGQFVTALGYLYLGAAIGLVGAGVAAWAKVDDIVGPKAQHPLFVGGLMLASLLALAAGQYLTQIGKVALGAPFTLLGSSLATWAKVGAALMGGGGGISGGGAAAGGAPA